MTTHLENLYQQTLLDHNKNPRHFGKLESATHRCHGRNPLCGDDYILQLQVESGLIKDIAFYGSGCAISKASASMMSAAVKNRSVEDAMALKTKFIRLLTEEEADKTGLNALGLFEGVKKFPVRVKCATLIWRALENAIHANSSDESLVSTE